MTPGVTSLLVSRRALRPRNQSSQLIGRSMGIEGTSDFEFISYFIHERFTLRHVTVFRALCNTLDLGPVHLDLAPQCDSGERARAIARRRILLGIDRNQNPLHQQIL